MVTENHFHLIDTIAEPRKVALIIEPPAINPASYEWIKNPSNYNKFEHVLTYCKDLLSVSPKFKFYVFGGCWIHQADRALHSKYKNISIIASAKRDTDGHRLRHEVVQQFRPYIDGVFGNGYQFIQNKIEGLRDYRFHIVLENMQQAGWVSEKLLDCIMTGCIPIYWGAPDIGEYFNVDGIIQFRTIDDLKNILPMCTPEYYESKLMEIAENWHLAHKYLIPEDAMWDSLFKPKYFS